MPLRPLLAPARAAFDIYVPARFSDTAMLPRAPRCRRDMRFGRLMLLEVPWCLCRPFVPAGRHGDSSFSGASPAFAGRPFAGTLPLSPPSDPPASAASSAALSLAPPAFAPPVPVPAALLAGPAGRARLGPARPLRPPLAPALRAGVSTHYKCRVSLQ